MIPSGRSSGWVWEWAAVPNSRRNRISEDIIRILTNYSISDCFALVKLEKI
jgi:hypothetical protein